jgi:hypothetical protein
MSRINSSDESEAKIEPWVGLGFTHWDAIGRNEKAFIQRLFDNKGDSESIDLTCIFHVT